MFGFLRSKGFWIFLILLVVAVGAFMTFGRGKPDKGGESDASAAQLPASPYAAVANGKADVEGGIISVAARRGGVVKEVYVQEGDRVTKGQILARQEDDDPRLAVERARAELAQIQAQTAGADIRYAAAVREYERQQQLAATNFIAAQRLDQSRDAMREAEAALELQRAAVNTARARLNEAQYDLEMTVIRAPVDGVIVRRQANPGAGASTLNVSTMFDLEPAAPRIVRAEVAEAGIPFIVIGGEVEIVPEADQTKVYVGRVLRRSAMFGARKLQSDDPTERSDERVVEVVVSAEGAPLLIGQRVLVKFMKPGQKAGAARPAPRAAETGRD